MKLLSHVHINGNGYNNVETYARCIALGAKQRGINLLKNSTEVKMFSESYTYRDMSVEVNKLSLGRYNSLELC